LGLLGGTLGLGLAVYGTALIKMFLPDNVPLPRVNELGIDHRVLTYSFSVSLLAGVLTGIFPARHGLAGGGAEWIERGSALVRPQCRG
jgi:hypothetical protein